MALYLKASGLLVVRRLTDMLLCGASNSCVCVKLRHRANFIFCHGLGRTVVSPASVGRGRIGPLFHKDLIQLFYRMLGDVEKRESTTLPCLLTAVGPLLQRHGTNKRQTAFFIQERSP